MDSQDQRKTHTPGNESHGVYVCHKCGWPFPNPHPSAKHRRAHKKICGTIEGFKVSLSEAQTRNLNGSDDEHGSDDDHKSPGPKILEVGNNEKGDIGIGEKIHRSEDEVFSDAVADFSDGGLITQGVKEHLQEENLDSGTSVERVDKKDSTFAGPSEHDDLNDASKLNLEARDDCQVQHPEITVEEGNTIELQGHMSGSTVVPLSNSVANLRAEESTISRSDDIASLSTESHPGKAEATPDVVPENQSFAGENVADCSLTSSTVETNLNGKDDETKSESKEVEIAAPSDTVVGETCEVESRIEVSDVVNSDHQVAEGAVNQKEKVSAEFLSVMAEDEPPHGSNSVGIVNASTNDVQVESSHASDVKILQKKEEADVDANNLPACDDRTDVPHPQSENDGFEDHEAVVSQNSSGLHSSESVKPEEGDLKDTVSEENSILLNPRQSAEKSDALSPDLHQVMDSSGSVNRELLNSEPTAEGIHAEEHTEVSPVESTERSDEIAVSMNAVKSEINESHLVPSSEEHRPVDVANSQQVCLSENILMASSNENPRDASFDAVTSEATSVISIDNSNHHEKSRIEINDVSEEGKDVGANLEIDLGTQTNDLQSSDLLELEVKQSSDIAQSKYAGGMDNIKKFDITDAQCSEIASNQIANPVILEPVIDEMTNIGLLSGSQEDNKEHEISSNVKVQEECDKSVYTSADLHQTRDAEGLMNAADDLSEKYASLSSLNDEPSAQNEFAVEDKQDGHPGREVSGTTAMPVQDQSGNNMVKHSSSGIDASNYSSSRCDSLEANWGSVSVLSMQSDATAVIDTETSPSIGLAASKESGETNLNNHNAASEKQPFVKSEMSETPSFMTLVEPEYAVSHKAPASEGQKGKNPQQPSSTTSQAGWFPYVTHVNSESQGRNKNEEIIAKVTNWSTSKEHTPLKSLLGEAIHSSSPKLEENSVSVNEKNGQKVAESNNGSGLTTVNSILGPESPSSAQAAIGDAAKEWNSPARYPADMKREKRKSKSRPYWIQLVCCSTVDLQRR